MRDFPVILCIALLLDACASGSDDGECQSGESLVNGQCVPVRGGGRDTGGFDGGDTSTGDDAGAGNDTGVDTGTACTPFSRECVSSSETRVCDPDGAGWTGAICGADQICEAGSCVVDQTAPCTPLAVLGCAGDTAQLICGSDGVTRVTSECPLEARLCAGGQCISTSACGDDKSYLGCDFRAVDLPNVNTPADSRYAITVSNGNDAAVNVRLEAGSSGAVLQQASVAAGTLHTFEFDRTRNQVNTSLNQNSYRVISDGPVTAHQFNPINNPDIVANDASLLLPIAALGSEYVVAAWPTWGSGRIYPGFVSIVSGADTTISVSVTPPAGSEIVAGGGVSGISGGQTGTYTLQPGAVLTLSGICALEGGGFFGGTETCTQTQDLSGTRVTATGPVAVFGGSSCANIPTDAQYCDHIEQQMPPLQAWGRNYIAAKFKPRGNEPDIYRVIAGPTATQLNIAPPINGVSTIGLAPYQVFEISTTQDFSVAATAPVLMAQYMVGSAYPGADNGCDRSGLGGNTGQCAIGEHSSCGSTAIGDPAELILVPTEQFLSSYIVLTPADYVEDNITIVAPTGAQLTIDGQPLPVTATPLSAGHEVYRFSVGDGVHRVDGTAPFGLYVYGYDCDVSYAYPGGLNLETL